MENLSSTVRRRAWINSSNHWLTLEELELEEAPSDLLSSSIVEDDVFSDGNIENWLLECGSAPFAGTSCQLPFGPMPKNSQFEDELSRCVDASVINTGYMIPEPGIAEHSPPIPGPSRCTSSVSEILRWCSEDAEETLYELGFGLNEPQAPVRIPPRFFTFPSQAQGINFRLFLDSQLRRIREEDPSLSLASRFRQVQVLTAMANAFYSLYSHVSRTPVQKLAPPEFTFSSSPVERMERFRSNIRSDPRSPVERLKDTVSKMCLYRGSPRNSESTSPRPSPKKRSSLTDVMDVALEKVKTGATKKLDLRQNYWHGVDVNIITDLDRSCDRDKEKQGQQSAICTDSLHTGHKICFEEMEATKQTHNIGVNQSGVKAADPDSRSHGVGASFPVQSVLETNNLEIDSCSTQRDSRTAHPKPVTQDMCNLISQQMNENICQAPLFMNNKKTDTLSLICSETECIDGSCPGILTDKAVTEPDGDSTSLTILPSNSSFSSCITVTGWASEDTAPWSLNATHSIHSSSAPPVQPCDESFKTGEIRYRNPLSHQCIGPNSNNLQQVNSFEMEEVHSTGEEDIGELESTGLTPQSSKHCQLKGDVVRADSMQSDSSGYADEESSPSHSR